MFHILLYLCFLISFNSSISGLKFERPELTSGELRYSNGRAFNHESELARLVLENPTEYWNKLSHLLQGYYVKKSKQTSRHWSRTVTQNERIQNHVSKECLEVLKYMIENPVKEEWIAKSKICYYFLFIR